MGIFFTPIMPKKIKGKILIFDETGREYLHPFKYLRPVMVFDYFAPHQYNYNRFRSIDNRADKNEAKPKKGEIIVNKNPKHEENGGLLIYNSCIDCSQVFIINENLFDSIVDYNAPINKNTPQLLDNKEMENLRNEFLKEMLEVCVLNQAPYLSILEINEDKDGNYYGVSKYLSDEKITDLKFKVESFKGKPVRRYEHFDFTNFRSVYDPQNINSTKRYEYGIKFCVNFLKKHFPERIDDFFKIQNLNKNLYFKNNLIVPNDKKIIIDTRNMLKQDKER